MTEDAGTTPQPGKYPCKSGKVQYANKADTTKQRKYLARKGDRNNTYKCDFCGWYHLGRRR
jgi:hypothetical protein